MRCRRGKCSAPEHEALTREAARTILSGDPERVRELLTTLATAEEVEEVAEEDGGPDAAGLSRFNLRQLEAPIAGTHDFAAAPLDVARVAFIAAMA